MNRTEQLNLFDETFGGLKNLLISKGHDYAQEGEILKNFKDLAEVSRLLGIDSTTPEGQCLEKIVLKIHRICNLLSKGSTPSNESLTDSADDMLGYAFLTKCIFADKASNITKGLGPTEGPF